MAARTSNNTFFKHQELELKRWRFVSQGRCMVCFGGALDAVRFCHAAQVALLFQRWPSDSAAVAGPAQLTPDNRPLLAGPRVAMAVHTAPAHECATTSQSHLRFPDFRAPCWQSTLLSQVLSSFHAQ